jgi:hypothetical protein
MNGTFLAIRPSSLLSVDHWRAAHDLTLTLKQARKSNDERWIKIDQYECSRAFRHFMNLLNRAVYGNAFKRHRKRLRVLPVLEGGVLPMLPEFPKEVAKRWHIHCAIEPPAHMDATGFERLICECWSKVDWGYRRTLVRDSANDGWIDYMLKPWQKSDFYDWSDSIDWENLYNPIADV